MHPLPFALMIQEGLKVTKDLKVEQSFEDLEATFQPGKNFSFDAILQLQKTNSKKFWSVFAYS